MNKSTSAAVAGPFRCDVCKKTFSANYNLRQHIKRFHNLDSARLLAPKLTNTTRNYQFSCKDCHRNFKYRRYLTSHQKNKHGLVKLVQVERAIKCPLCSYTSKFKRDLILHFKSDHDILINTKILEFDNKFEFNTWLALTEKNTKSKFVKESGEKKSGHRVISHFNCHRSGNFIPKGKGLRHAKIQGSNKIGAFCPAGIKLTEHWDSNNCQIKYIDVHVGHEIDPRHLFLTSVERESLAVKIAAKMSFDTILDEARDFISQSSLDRLHLLTKKDLFNIEASFNLHSAAIRHRSDAISIESWASEMQKNGCILFYKPQETGSEKYPQLKDEDFVLIIMNDGQREILKKYGTEAICIDSTHDTNGYGFELTTLLVLDDLRQGFPCCFLISNRGDQEVISIFFTHIKEQVGNIVPKIFMSDIAETYYNSWLQVMSAAQFRLYCSWHVDRAWRKNLSKIACKEKQVAIYKTLRTLMHETEPAAFTKMIKQFIDEISSDAITLDFANYFQEYYLNKAQLWAYCYWLHSGLNTNMHIERMHQTIKYLYLHGKHTKSLDKAIDAVMGFVRDKLLDRLIVIHERKITTQLKDIRSRHATSKTMNEYLVIKNHDNWGVLTSESSEIYTIKENNVSCNCQLVCVNCNACIHRYSCSCLDCTVKWNMCKHIHLLCIYQNRKEETTRTRQVVDEATAEDTDDNNLDIHCANENTTDESPAILAELSKNSCDQESADTLTLRKEKMKKTILDILEGITSNRQMDAFQRLIAPIAPTLSFIKQTESKYKTTTMLPVSNIPHNKQILPQRRLFSTKRNRSGKIRSISLPNRDKSVKIVPALLLPRENNIVHSNN